MKKNKIYKCGCIKASENAQHIKPEDRDTLLSAKNINLRLQYAQANQNRTAKDCKNIVWSSSIVSPIQPLCLKVKKKQKKNNPTFLELCTD